MAAPSHLFQYQNCPAVKNNAMHVAKSPPASESGSSLMAFSGSTSNLSVLAPSTSQVCAATDLQAQSRPPPHRRRVSRLSPNVTPLLTLIASACCRACTPASCLQDSPFFCPSLMGIIRAAKKPAPAVVESPEWQIPAVPSPPASAQRAAAAAGPTEPQLNLWYASNQWLEAPATSAGARGAAWKPKAIVHGFDVRDRIPAIKPAAITPIAANTKASILATNLVFSPGTTPTIMLLATSPPHTPPATTQAPAEPADSSASSATAQSGASSCSFGGSSGAPAMAHCLRPAIAGASTGQVAGPDAATPSPVAAPEAVVVPHATPTLPLDRMDSAHDQQQSGCCAAPPAVLEAHRFQTFELFDAKWHGEGQAQGPRALMPAGWRGPLWLTWLF